MSIETWTIKGHTLEFIPEVHQYVCDGLMVPSVTQMLKFKFGNKYAAVDKETLNKAADAGTAVHSCIERWCKYGEESDLPELRNFKFLKQKYDFEVLKNEVPVILFGLTRPICAGRLDMVITSKEGLTIADIKRTSALDKEYLALQLNLYAIAYQQCYGGKIEALRGLHLRGDTRKFVSIPINEQKTWDFIAEYQKGEADGSV